MNKIIHLLFFVVMIFTFFNCEKERMKNEDALLTGRDWRYCLGPVCGGYWIEIGQDTLRFLDFPDNSDFGDLDVDTVFPIQVEVKWRWPEDETLKRIEDLIVVEKISKK